jgi:hypothetical protein
MNDKQLYYCQTGAHLWYYGDDGTPLYFGEVTDRHNITDEQVENATDKNCGCND